MHGEEQFFPQKPTFQHNNEQGGYNMHSAPFAPFFGGTYYPPVQNQSMPIHGFNFQPSEACPRNFIICDQTANKSQIMFHPVMNSKFFYPGVNSFPSLQDSAKRNAINYGREASPLKEDSDDIDVLLSYEDEEEEGCDDDEVSTARTYRNYQSDLLDSCSSHGSRPRKSSLPTFSEESSGNESNYSCRKRQKMRKMVKALKRIVPGGNQMNTVTVLGEAVRYLKSLKVEVETLGVGSVVGS